MIDSIHFSIHNLEVHKRLVDHLYKPHVSGTELLHVEMTPDEFDHVLKQQVKHGTLFRDFTTGKFTRMAYRDWISSYRYDVAFAIRQDHIEFNFSIPKYLYGTNVFQFLPHRWDKDYHSFVALDQKRILEVAYERFNRFMKYFLKKHFGDLVEPRLVEITQLDLCFVKCFPTKEHAIYYISELKRIIRRRWRDSSRLISNYNTGVWFKTTDYIFKCYHKGEEFERHDKKELRKVVRKGEFSSRDIENIQFIADHMVRYEMALKPRFFNRAYKRKYGVDGYDPLFVKRAVNLRSNEYFKIGKKKYTWKDLTSGEKKMYRHVLKEYDKVYVIKWSGKDLQRREMFLDEDYFKTLYRLFMREVNFHSVKFSGAFDKWFSLSTNDFFSQLEDILIEKYGREKGKKILVNVSIDKLKWLMRKMAVHSLKELMIEGDIGRSTYFRYQKVLKAMGIGQTLASQETRETDNHFREYYRLVNENANGMRIFKSVI